MGIACRTATESSPDPEAMQPAKNVLHLLASILPPQPVTQLLKSPLAALPVDATITSQQAATLPQPSADSEQAAVLDFVQKQTTNSGLLEVSAALLETLLSQPGHPDVKAAAEDLLQLEACVRGDF